MIKAIVACACCQRSRLKSLCTASRVSRRLACDSQCQNICGNRVSAIVNCYRPGCFSERHRGRNAISEYAIADCERHSQQHQRHRIMKTWRLQCVDFARSINERANIIRIEERRNIRWCSVSIAILDQVVISVQEAANLGNGREKNSA